MQFSEIEFASLFSYTPRGNLEVHKQSRNTMIRLKNDSYLESEKILMSEYVASGIKKYLEKLPFADYFNENAVLVPTPKSSLVKSDTLWVPECLATALVKNGLGKDVKSCLERTTAVQRSSTSSSANRPKAVEHYNSMTVQKILFEPDEIVLVDDVVTRGATLLGAANKLADAFPKARIRAFAAMRTISNPLEFTKIFDPCKGTISLVGNESFRNP